jgi:outer membrane protein TolC
VKPTVQAIDAQARALTADRHAFELGVRGQIAAGRSAADLAEAAYAASQRGLAAAEESYQVRLDLFDNDRATTLEVASAETALTAARIAAIDALIDRRIAWTQLRHAAGLDLGTRATARVHSLSPGAESAASSFRSSSEAP